MNKSRTIYQQVLDGCVSKQLVEVTRSTKKVVSRSSTALSWLRKKKKQKTHKNKFNVWMLFLLLSGTGSSLYWCFMHHDLVHIYSGRCCEKRTCPGLTKPAAKKLELPENSTLFHLVSQMNSGSELSAVFLVLLMRINRYSVGFSFLTEDLTFQNALITLYLPSCSQGCISQFFCHQSFIHSLIYWPLLLKNYKCV